MPAIFVEIFHTALVIFVALLISGATVGLVALGIWALNKTHDYITAGWKDGWK